MEESNKNIETDKIMDGKEKRQLNLIPAKKGEIRNPYGRPKKNLHIPDILNKLGENKIPPNLLDRFKNTPEVLNSPNRLQALMELVYNMALKGNEWAIEFIAERTEGKAKVTLDVESNVQPMILNFGPRKPLPNNSLPQEGLPPLLEANNKDNVETENIPKEELDKDIVDTQ